MFCEGKDMTDTLNKKMTEEAAKVYQDKKLVFGEGNTKSPVFCYAVVPP